MKVSITWKPNDSVSVVTHYLDHFIDGVIWNIYGNSVCQHFTPLGQELDYRTANQYYRRLFRNLPRGGFKEDGGLGQQDNAKGEDLALYLKMTANRMKIGVIPKCGLLYRRRNNSITSTYPLFPSEQRLARNSAGYLTTFDAYCLHGALRSFNVEVARLNHQITSLNHNRACNHEYNTKLQLAKRWAISSIKKSPFFRSKVITIFESVFKRVFK